MYVKFLRAGTSGIDYGVPYKIVEVFDGICAGRAMVYDEWGRGYVFHVRNLFLTFVFCDEKGKDL